MTDKPVPAKIILTLTDPANTGEKFLGLSSSLYTQNLVFSEPRELRRTDNSLELIVTFRDSASFKSWQENLHIRKYWADKFQAFLSREPETVEEKDVIIEIDEVTNCICEEPEFYILQGRSLKYIDELTCSNCSGQVPYSRIPLEIEIENWQRHFQRTYLNWLDSSFLEKDAYKELTNYKKGKLNVEGEKIRAQVSDHFKIPVYMSYFAEQPDSITSCVLCEDLGLDSGLKNGSRICKACNTIS